MEPAQIQLLFNVVSITGVSSLASFCYLLRKENRKLATALKSELNEEERDHTVEAVHPVAITGSAANSSPRPTAPIASAVSTNERDIREFAAHRRTAWVKEIASAAS